MTDNFEKKVAVDGPVVNAGELGSSTFSPGQALPAGPLGLGQRWTVAPKREVVLRLLRDEPVQLLSRQLGVEIFRLEQWREKAIGGIDASLKQRKGDPVQAELDSAMKRIGELTMQVELLEAKDGDLRPFGAAEVAAMSAATSPGTGLAYGLQRVCAAWGMARSSFYAMTSGQHAEQRRQSVGDRSPRSRTEALLVAIEADLETSPWEGEGYRKVWARLRVCRDIRVARKRVLRLMRENNLLSPHRCRRRGGNPMTVRSSLMPRTSCGAPMAFGCSRWTTAGAGSSPPSSIGTPSVSAGMSASAATASPPCSRSPWGLPGCMARPRPARLGGWPCGMDHGSQYLSDHFTNQIKFWGIQPSYAFVAEPRPTASPSGSIAR